MIVKFLIQYRETLSVVATTKQHKQVNLLIGYQVGITRELNKESLLNCYPIYISYRWSMLTLNNPALMSMYCS